MPSNRPTVYLPCFSLHSDEAESLLKFALDGQKEEKKERTMNGHVLGAGQLAIKKLESAVGDKSVSSPFWSSGSLTLRQAEALLALAREGQDEEGRRNDDGAPSMSSDQWCAGARAIKELNDTICHTKS